MKLLAIFTGALLTSTSSALPGYPWGRPWGGRGDEKAVYFLRVDPAGSSIVAIKVGRNGMLHDSSSVTSTDGVGLQTVNGTTLAPVPIDPLQSQQSVSIGGDYLFTVNSGSNTAVMFTIDPSDPLKLTLIGAPASTLGEYPVSIAYSSKYGKACVLNGGAVNGVTCYSVDKYRGLIPDGVGLREFGFPATTPSQLGGAKGSGSDIQFTGDSSKLITTFKGRNMPKMTLGHVSIFDVDEDGNVAPEATDNRVSPIQSPFGFALSGDNLDQIYVSDAGFGGVLVSLDPGTNTISALSVVNDTAFVASCWAVWSSATNKFYDTPAASPNIGVVDSSGKLVKVFDYDASLGGGVDSVVDGTTLYLMTGINAIAVIDLETENQLQTFTYSTTTDRPFWTGMAMWPANPLLSGGL